MRVIEVINKRVTQTKQMLPHYVLQENEMVSSVGERGQVMLEDGTFIDYVPTPEEEAETLKQKQLKELETELAQARTFNDTEEITRCQQAYADLNDGKTIQTKTEVEAELLDANTDRDYYFEMILDDEGMWG